MEYLKDPEVDTILKAFIKTVEIKPDSEWLGTRVGDAYEWKTFKEVFDRAESLSLGFMEKNLCPVIEAEESEWRFMGMIGPNSVDWASAFMANMFQNITCVPL